MTARSFRRRRRVPAPPDRTAAPNAPLQAVRAAVLARLEADPLADERSLVEFAGAAAPLLGRAEVEAAVSLIREERLGLGPVARLLADRSVTELLIDGPGPVTVERSGRLWPTDVVVDRHDIDLLIERVLAPLNLRVDRTSPIVDARLADGSRVNIVVPPLAVDGPAVAIRRFPLEPVELAAFGPPPMAEVLTELVAERASVLIVGPTSSGKTTLLNALGGLIDQRERIVCIEDTAELRLRSEGVVRLEARPPNSEGVGGVDLRRLVLTSLRLRPDRLVIGEVRGPEAFDLLLALTSGHRGCLTSCHAADAAGGLRRLELLAAMAGSGAGPAELRDLVRDGLDAVVVVERIGGRRGVVSIAMVDGDRTVTRWSTDRRFERARAA